MIFLSDGECSLPETAIQNLCRSAIRHGCVCHIPINRSLTGRLESHFLFMLLLLAQMILMIRAREFLSTYTYNNRSPTSWLSRCPFLLASLSRRYSTLRMMARISREMQRSAPPDPLFPVAARIKSSFNTALDTVRTHAARSANKQG